MSDNKKYYYLKLKESFFDSKEMKILESQKNGIEYQNLYLKLCLLSLENEGKLTFKDTIPYDLEMLSTILRVNIDTIKVCIELLNKLKLIEILDNKTMYMLDIQSLIGRGSTEGERKAKYRKRIDDEKRGTMSQISSTRDKERDRDRTRDKEREKMDDLNRPYLPLAELLYNEHLKHDPCFLGGKDLKKTFNRWANDIRLLVENDRIKDKNAIETVKTIIIWCQRWEGNGNFSWRPNILSGKKLRDKFPVLYSMYLQNNTRNERTKQEYEKTWEKKYKHRLKELEN